MFLHKIFVLFSISLLSTLQGFSATRVSNELYYGEWAVDGKEELVNIKAFKDVRDVVLNNVQEKRYLHINFLSTNKNPKQIYVTGLRLKDEYEKNGQFRTFFKIVGVNFCGDTSSKKDDLFAKKAKIMEFIEAMNNLRFVYIPWGKEFTLVPECFALSQKNYTDIKNKIEEWTEAKNIRMGDLDFIKKEAPQIFHTEFLMMYDLAYDTTNKTWDYDKIDGLEIFSYFDMCDFCESFCNQTHL